jgi:hypothetical protein
MIKSLALALALITSTEARSDPVYLACSGMAERKILSPARYSDTVSMTVDLANNALTLEDVEERLPIQRVSRNTVTVNSPGKYGDTVSISLNRVTGNLFMTTFNDTGQIAWEFQGLCKPAKRLF